MANWLDTAFRAFDHGILQAVHGFTTATNGIFTLPLEIITFLANKGLGMILLGLLLCCFAKSRRVGVTVLFAIACGALITNVTVKNIVERARPFESSESIRQWWIYISENSFFDFTVSDHSFPSGHATATMAAMTAVFASTNKKKSWPVFILVFLMCFSRLYLMVHYPTDVLVGVLAGAIGAIGGYWLVKLLYRFLSNHSDNRLVRIYNNFDLIAFFRGSGHKKAASAPEISTENADTAPEDEAK